MKYFFLCLAAGLLFWPGPLAAFAPGDLKNLLKEHDCRNCDLSGADLSGLDLSQGDFEGADFTFANLEGANFSGANLKGAQFGYDFFTPTPAKQGQTREAVERELARKFRRDRQRTLPEELALLTYTLWDRSYLKTVSVKGTRLVETSFAGSNLEGADFTACNLEEADFTEAFVKEADFSYALLGHAQFERAYAPQAVFYKANLKGARFVGADLSGALLYKALYEPSLGLVMFKQAKLGAAINQKGQFCKEGSLGRCD